MSRPLAAARPGGRRTATVGAFGALAVAAGLVIAAPASAASATLSGISPTSATVGSTVTVSGSGLSTASRVDFPKATGIAPASVAPDGSWLTVAVPTAARTGTLSVQGASGGTGFTLLAAPTQIVQHVTPTTVDFPQHPTVGGRLTRTDAVGGPVTHQWVRLQRYTGGAWHDGSGGYTDGSGTILFTPLATVHTRFRLVFRGNATYKPSHSAASSVSVRPWIKLRAPGVAKTYTDNLIHGRVHPETPGPVELQRYVSGSWSTIDTTKAHSDGSYRFTVRPTSKRTLVLRVHRPAGRGLLAATSPLARVPVVARDLRSGDEGHDVLVLQRRLKRLHYDVGAVNGTYGSDTAHAVTAFQKVQGLPRDGTVGKDTWAKLANPHGYHLRFPTSGPAVEVNLTKQVVVYAIDGKVRRIIDASTGGGYFYSDSSGNRSQALTPEGHFSIRYKINDWHKSKLGYMYRPAYFTTTGFAIHGDSYVPSYPASHGCVRITVAAMDRMYDKLAIGVPVSIYGHQVGT